MTAGSLADVVEVLAGRRLAVLTGAGVSTDSGIPDYRGPDSPPRTPMTFQQFTGDEGFRRHYWARNHVGWQRVRRTVPNAGHRALAEMEQRGVVSGLITQNVDLLHEVAGSRNVIDLHGRYDRVRCLSCGTVISRSDLAARLDALNPEFLDAVEDIEIAPDADAVIEQTSHFVVADCAVCGGMLKPDIVYFGENVPRERVDRAYAMVDDAGALLGRRVVADRPVGASVRAARGVERQADRHREPRGHPRRQARHPHAARGHVRDAHGAVGTPADSSRTMTAFDTGVLLPIAVDDNETRTFASGK